MTEAEQAVLAEIAVKLADLNRQWETPTADRRMVRLRRLLLIRHLRWHVARFRHPPPVLVNALARSCY